MNIIEIYTDGACSGNPGPGGWGAVLIAGEKCKEIYGGEAYTTNNQMELRACIESLRVLKSAAYLVVLNTDSKYVIDGITKWIDGWKRRGWRTKKNTPVKNKERWIELNDLVQQFRMEWRHVKGHNGDPGNERADELAKMGIDLAIF